jgi:LysR family glycine cleavage system transcriptional activator
MTRDLPSLNAVRMFETAARFENFTRAAEALFVTQGAVSRQIKLLEDQLGCALFTREGPRLELTKDGARFYAVAAEGQGAIRRGALDLKRAHSAPSLTVSVLPSFAAKWLVQRAVRFQDRNKNIEIRIVTAYEPVDFTIRPDIDAAIRWGKGHWPGTYSESLFTETLFPVCSPKFMESHAFPKTASELATLPLIRPLEQFDQWAEWFRAASVPAPKPVEQLRYSDALLLQQAALEGHGIDLARSLLVEDELKSGRLLRMSDVSIEAQNSFYFVCPRGRESDERVSKLLAWLRSEAANSGSG